MSRILVIDDDPSIVRTLEIMLRAEGHAVTSAGSGEAGLAAIAGQPLDVALVDLELPGIDGTAVVARLRESHPQARAVIITAHGSIETAVAAMKAGAFDYLTKPFTPQQVRHRLDQIAHVARLESEVADLRQRVGDRPFGGAFTTQNAATLRLLEVARSVAATDATVLIAGESGTGKTLLARLIHQHGARAAGPFVVVDCAAFQESLLESELFGHTRGAFTGAIADAVGKVATAAGGTLFLDEIGEVPLHLQSKLLRLVEARTYERLGDPRPRTVDARIVAATHRDLHAMARAGEFREDLFYRLSVVDLHLPALRNRPEDVLPLARAFMTAFAETHGRPVTGWTPAAERALVGASWPGNVRELAHAIERAVLFAPGDTLDVEHLPARIARPAPDPEGASLHLTLAALEEAHVRRILALGLSQEESAARLGIDPSTLWRKRKRYGL